MKQKKGSWSPLPLIQGSLEVAGGLFIHPDDFQIDKIGHLRTKLK